MDQKTVQNYLADNPPLVVPLEIKAHFENLTPQQKRYAHYLSHASWSGSRVCLRQASPESEDIFNLILKLHGHVNGNWDALRQQSGVTEEESTHFLNYAAQFLGNSGNYKSFGDTKFIPRLPAKAFEAIASVSAETRALYEKVQGYLYESDEAGMLLGFPDAGHVSAYYPNSKDIRKAEIEAIGKVLQDKGLLPENTRLTKTADGNFDLLIASADKSPSAEDQDIKQTEIELDGDLAGKTLRIVFGDYNAEMAKIAKNMQGAADNALNEHEKAMCTAYAKSFKTGSLNAFLESQRQWIRDKGPAVETNIGFIETYRDPNGTRGEWEGFVAVVNQERTKAFGKLVAAAPSLIGKLPWEKEFEKDKFLAPDFTSLEVLTFAGSGVPLGINIPNYDVIRQNEGFKNVSLGNVMNAKVSNEPVPFISDADLDLFRQKRDPAFEVQVGLHELLGHGCGKLLQETAPGVYNFDIDNPPVSPLTGKPVTSWYKPGQTWGSVFGSLAATYEECRAEAVAMALVCDFGVLQIFGFGNGAEDIDGPAGDILYTSYLTMARAGVTALEFWDPKARKWGQAHMQARYSILQVFLQAGGGFCTLDHSAPDLSDLTIKLDRHKILSHGRPAIQAYLQKLGIFKATADFAAASSMYNELTAVGPWWAEQLRPEVLRRKQPRKVFVQANTVLGPDGSVALKEYEATPAGLIQSYADRTYI